MSDVRDVLVRGSKKIIQHYEFLISRTPSERERTIPPANRARAAVA